MSVNTKNGSDNISCATNPGGGTPLVTPEPKTNNHMANHRTDLHYTNHLANPSPICQQNVRSSKIVRILTVLAYMVAVSMAAILLSIYYTFIWNPYENIVPNSFQTNGSKDFNRDWSFEPIPGSDFRQMERFLPLPYSVQNFRVNTSPMTMSVYPHATIANDQSLRLTEQSYVSSSSLSPLVALDKASGKIMLEQANPVTRLLLSSRASTANSSGEPAVNMKTTSSNMTLLQADLPTDSLELTSVSEVSS